MISYFSVLILSGKLAKIEYLQAKKKSNSINKFSVGLWPVVVKICFNLVNFFIYIGEGVIVGYSPHLII